MRKVLLISSLLLAAAGLSAQQVPTTPRTGCEPDNCISKVLYLPNFSTPTELQDVTNMFRGVLEFRQVYPDASEHTLSLKGTPEQLAIAEKLVAVLESLRSSGGHDRSSVLVYEPKEALPKPTVSESAPEQSSRAAGLTACDLKLTTCFIKALYLPNLSIIQLQDATNRVRSNLHMARIQPGPSIHVIVFRGTSEQVALAEKLINE